MHIYTASFKRRKSGKLLWVNGCFNNEHEATKKLQEYVNNTYPGKDYHLYGGAMLESGYSIYRVISRIAFVGRSLLLWNIQDKYKEQFIEIGCSYYFHEGQELKGSDFQIIDGKAWHNKAIEKGIHKQNLPNRITK